MGIRRTNYVSRSVFLDYLQKKELEYSVQNWKSGEIHLWPIIKIGLFFKLVELERVGDLRKNNSKITSRKKIKAFKLLWLIFKSLVLFTILKIKKRGKPIDVFFCDSSSHRVWLDKEFVNRYFLPIRKQLEKLRPNITFLGLSDDNLTKDQYPSRDNMVFLLDYVEGAKLYWKITQCKVDIQAQGLENFLKDVEKDFPYLLNSKAFGNELRNKIKDIKILQNIQGLLLNKHNPKLVFELCYYSKSRYAMNVAASRRNIPTIEIQHGGLGKEHVSYYGWENMPASGYSVFPEYFWSWDVNSFKLIKEWVTTSHFHKSLLGGNPWLGFSLLTPGNYKFPDDKLIVLYTLQDQEVEDYIFDVIHDSSLKYEWWLRPHPRFTKIALIAKEKLMAKGLFSRVNLVEAASYPLPIIISKCAIHISVSSGSILEAATMGIPSLILGSSGGNYYKNLIDSREAFLVSNKNAQDLLCNIEAHALGDNKKRMMVEPQYAIPESIINEVILPALNSN